ncbi:type II secretion system protein [Candidatus Uhrbacteria bacterium]|nr:type II secretion system protein [Candidatus Uhrbacteria bacterium]
MLRGISLIEIIIALGVFAILMLVGNVVIVHTFRLPQTTFATIERERSARAAIEGVTDEARRMATSNRGDYPIAYAGAQSLTFYTNTDNDALFEQVRYFLDGSTLKRGVTKPTGSPLTYNPAAEVASELARDVTTSLFPLFTYFDANYSGSESPLALPINVSAIRFIRFTLTIDDDPKKLPLPFILESGVAPRALKDNL